MIDTSIKAFEAIGRAIGNASTVTATNITVEFADVVPGQFGLEESELPPQPAETIGNLTAMTDVAVGLEWPKALAVEWANRYVLPSFLFPLFPCSLVPFLPLPFGLSIPRPEMRNEIGEMKD
jgi:hypothetical protein